MVGDICLDRWCTYDPATSEPSAETGIPRLESWARKSLPEAAEQWPTILRLWDRLRFRCWEFVATMDSDIELDRALMERGIDSSLMVSVPNWQTFTYTKLLNSQTGSEDQPRADFINTRPLPSEAD